MSALNARNEIACVGLYTQVTMGCSIHRGLVPFREKKTCGFGHCHNNFHSLQVVRRTYSSCGDRCFASAGPRLWNNLLAHLRQTVISFEQFKRLLKTFLFSCWERGGGALWL